MQKIPLKNSDGFYTNVGLILRKLAFYRHQFIVTKYPQQCLVTAAANQLFILNESTDTSAGGI
jgi:hypothetical protein